MYRSPAAQPPTPVRLPSRRSTWKITAWFSMDMEGGIKASYLQCHYAPDYYRNYVFIGTEGRMESLDNGTVEVKARRSNTGASMPIASIGLKERQAGTAAPIL